MASELQKLPKPEIQVFKSDYAPSILTRSLSTLPTHFSKRIRDLENEITHLKTVQVTYTQHKALQSKDVSYAKLKIKSDEQDLYIKTLSRELSKFGEGAYLLEKVNQLTCQLESCELERSRLNKLLLNQISSSPQPDTPTESLSGESFKLNSLEATVKDLKAELEIREGDLRRAKERIEDMKKARSEVAEYTATLEANIAKLEQDKETLIQIIVERDKTIDKLESDMSLLEQSSKDEQEFFFQQLARKTNALTSEIKELENRLKAQSIEKDETVMSLNKQIQELTGKYSQLKKENVSIKEKNESLSDISLNFKQKLFEVQDQLSSKFAKTQEDLMQKIHTLMRENAELEQRLSEITHTEGHRVSIVDTQSFEDEMRKLEELRQSWTHVQSYNEMLSAKHELLKNDLANKEVRLKQLEVENVRYNQDEKLKYLSSVISESVRYIPGRKRC